MSWVLKIVLHSYFSLPLSSQPVPQPESPDLIWLWSLPMGGSKGHGAASSVSFWVGRERKKRKNTSPWKGSCSDLPDPLPFVILPQAYISFSFLALAIRPHSLASLLFLWTMGHGVVLWACRAYMLAAVSPENLLETHIAEVLHQTYCMRTLGLEPSDLCLNMFPR